MRFAQDDSLGMGTSSVLVACSTYLSSHTTMSSVLREGVRLDDQSPYDYSFS